jgi:hypothetical protein
MTRLLLSEMWTIWHMIFGHIDDDQLAVQETISLEF